MKGAAIDLGSNSFICLIYEMNKEGELKTLQDQIVLTRLSEGIDVSKKISEQAMVRAEEGFKGFQKLFAIHKVEKIQAVATSAARDAQNQKAFLDLAAKYKIPVRILSGDEEAKMTFEGVKDHFSQQDGLIIDIGGGSTEFVSVAHGVMKDRVSLNLGVVRFSERYLLNSDFKTQESKLRQAIKLEFANSDKMQNLKKFKADVFLAVSGTPTSAASILLNGFESDQIEGFEIKSKDFKYLINEYGFLSKMIIIKFNLFFKKTEDNNSDLVSKLLFCNIIILISFKKFK
jgi:exopolyphosphatase/guanosine-5'-triphosphate,3'-diphosphate pyrophosphatase